MKVFLVLAAVIGCATSSDFPGGTVHPEPRDANVSEGDDESPHTLEPDGLQTELTARETTTQSPVTQPPFDPNNCTCGQRRDLTTRIVGGTDADINQFPWRCYLQTTGGGSAGCGCSIISNNWAMTATHCTRPLMPYLQSGGVLAVAIPTGPWSAQRIEVSAVFEHPGYNSRTFNNDISLLKLYRPVAPNSTLPDLFPVCLPWKYAREEFAGTTVTASGWGATSQGGDSTWKLQKVDLPILTTAQCSWYYRGKITSNMICTYQPGKGSCQGDSGGSMDLLRNGRSYAIGIVSWGIGCAKRNYPAVQTKITKYLDWIRTTTSEDFCKM